MASGAAGDGGLGVAALFVAVVVWMSAPEGSWAQTATTTTTANMSNATVEVCHTHCCSSDALRVEARLACQEFRKYGVKDSTCVLWQLNAARFCEESCSNCTVIAKAMYDQCLFFLQGEMEFTLAMEQCRVVQKDFEHAGRCNSVCNVTVDECHSPAASTCMRQCGNFQTCECFMWRGVFGEPDSCEGKTILEGYIPNVNPPTKYSCTQIGEHCKNHRPDRSCGKYKWCKTDMCLVKNVTCPLTDTCQANGACEKSTGDCYYTFRDDGVNCTDGLFYTHDDICHDGVCAGWIDRCMRDDVQCGTKNPCLEAEGTCHPRTGACVFEHKPMGTLCSSAPKIPYDGECDEGLCRRTVIDKCAGVNCSHLGAYCFKDATCEPITGQCTIEAYPEGMVCTDGDPDTHDDMCIEGRCVGHKWQQPKFKPVAEGFCADKSGNMLRRYFADTFDRDVCEEQCSKDPACVAYSFGFHSCSIHGSPRAVHPSVGWWGHIWREGNMWGDRGSSITDEEISVVPRQPNEQVVECFQKVEVYVEPEIVAPLGHEIAFGILISMLVCTPGFWLFLWKLRQHPDEEPDFGDGEAFQDRSAFDNLEEFKTIGESGLLALHGRGDRNKGRPPASPREGNASAIAAIQDGGKDEDIGDYLQRMQRMQAASDNDNDDSAIPVQVDSGEPVEDVKSDQSPTVTDPRGEVDESPAPEQPPPEKGT